MTGAVDQLPVEAILPQLLDSLGAAPNLVLIAPPGAGKSTMVAPALLGEVWCTDRILLLSPRRLAARMVAERMADLIGEPVGKSVGYATRMDSKQSAAARLLVLTEGIFRNRIIADPELAGISAVLFDEVHERSLDSDFGLALALEAQSAFRPDLRLIAMSATLDGDRFARLMNDAPVIESEGKSWPLTLRYIGRRPELPIDVDIVSAVRLALVEEGGDILAFLPGAGEIDRAAENLAKLSGDVVIHKLHGAVDPDVQRLAVRPDSEGRRKIILATNIAETSLTIDGVRIVIDSGLARRARFDQAAGVTRLVTERVSLSAATQRSGRAARQGPGTAYRLWEEAGNGGLPPFDPPQILESDLAPLLLDCAIWGERDPAALRWLDPPPAAALTEARKALIAIDAVGNDGMVTAHGRKLALLPLPPALAHMVLIAAESGQAEEAAQLALLLQERGLGGQGEDIEQRAERFRRETRPRANAARSLAKRIALLAAPQGKGERLSTGEMIATAFPDRVAKRRDRSGENWVSVSGRGLRLDSASPLASAEWLAVADIQGAAYGARILSAAAIDEAQVLQLLSNRIETSQTLRYDRAADRIEARQRRRLGAIVLTETTVAADPSAAAEALLIAVREHGLDILPWPDNAKALRQRAVYAGNNALADTALTVSAEDWLPPLLRGVGRMRDISPSSLSHALDNILGYSGKAEIDRIAPASFTSPAGTTHPIDYEAEAGPTVELRVQALYGLDIHPAVGVQQIPLVLSLTSPAGRPIQTTRDLPQFWRGSWRDVAKDMRGRYPKHNWPDAAWESVASLKTKKAQLRDKPQGA